MKDDQPPSFTPRSDIDVIDRHGKVLYFSLESFIKHIAQGDACFICGADPTRVAFNNEHVIPDWILSRYNLHSRRVTLPNGGWVKYGQYTVPCCEDCNAQMSETFEKPISDLVKGGYRAVIRQMLDEGPLLIFNWLALIYLKTQLKDKQLRFNRDRRESDETVAEHYDWVQLHHIHCVARAFYTRAKLNNGILGTTFVWPAYSLPGQEEFDYGDSHPGKTLLLRLGDVAFISVLNDSGFVRGYLDNGLSTITGPLSSLQLRELMVRMAYTNMHLIERPKYHSGFEGTYDHPHRDGLAIADCPYEMTAALPEKAEIEEVDPRVLGDLLVSYLKGPIDSLVPEEDRETLITHMADGMHSLIFDPEIGFLENPTSDTASDVISSD